MMVEKKEKRKQLRIKSKEGQIEFEAANLDDEELHHHESYIRRGGAGYYCTCCPIHSDRKLTSIQDDLVHRGIN